ncbi:hypothetical protein D6D25_02057 [Aureobasidium pullulans]|nr:hypothetical protein D6D25_02057 [Aureobasidium pullulans]
MRSPFIDAPLPDAFNYQQTKLFSGIQTSRDAHRRVSIRRRSTRSQPSATHIHQFTLPYRNRSITMNHPNDKPTKPRIYKNHTRSIKKHNGSKKNNKNAKVQNKSHQNDQSQQSNKIDKNSQSNQPPPPNNTDQAQASHLSSAPSLPTMSEPQTSEPGISERRGIRWIPDDLKEPTSTLVLTSSRKQFVDIRIFCQRGHPLPNEGGPSELLDWGIAGESSSTFLDAPSLHHPSNPPPPTDGSLRSICHTTFSHWIDSRTDTPGPDQGDMYPQNENLTLELGSMYNPLTRSEQPYEEHWADFSASPVDGKRWSIVIDLDDPGHRAKGRVIRVGEHCQAILKVGEQVSVERWKFETSEVEGQGAWKRLARLGDMFLPVSLTFIPERVVEGNTLTYGDHKWEVKEVHSW